MALQGTLDTFALADLVRLMATTTKTGELTVEDEGQTVSGRLWFADGDLVDGGSAGTGSAEDDLFALLRLDRGSFRFEPDTGPGEGVDGSSPQDAMEVLAAAEARLEAWRPIEALVPHPDVVVRLRPELETDEVTIDRDTWRQVQAVAGGTTARGLAVSLDLDEVATATMVKALADQGLVEVDAAAGTGTDFAVDAGLDILEDEVDTAIEAEDDTGDEDDAPTSGWGTGWDVEAGGSLAVDLDSHLGDPVTDHRYLGGEASALPEALPDGADEATSAAEVEAPTLDEDDLALQLEALSPAAARAVAAATASASADDDAGDDDAGRRVLRRIISSGRG